MKDKTKFMNDAEDTFKLDVVRVKLVKEAPLYSELPIQTPYEAAATIGELLCEIDREVVCVVNLQTDGKPINVTFASVGALNEAMLHPREILKVSILSNAASILLIHSHPSGNLLPSKLDTMMTDRMNSVCEMVGIGLIDHVIVGGENKEFFSFREKGLIKNPGINYQTDYRSFSFSNSLVGEKKKKEFVMPASVKSKTDENGTVHEYDENGNVTYLTYYENSDRYWEKREYDENGKMTHYEDSNGNWEKREYDANGNNIYYEDSDGAWSKYKHDENGNVIYSEDLKGEWSKYEYNEQGKRTYYEDSNGNWEKCEYDAKGNMTYCKNSRGYWEKHEYDKNGNRTYYENSRGKKVSYDKSSVREDKLRKKSSEIEI